MVLLAMSSFFRVCVVAVNAANGQGSAERTAGLSSQSAHLELPLNSLRSCRSSCIEIGWVSRAPSAVAPCLQLQRIPCVTAVRRHRVPARKQHQGGEATLKFRHLF